MGEDDLLWGRDCCCVFPVFGWISVEYLRYWTLLVGEREFCAWEDFVDCMEMVPVSGDRGRNQSFFGWQNIDLRLHA